jgi:hypothetical protein
MYAAMAEATPSKRTTAGNVAWRRPLCRASALSQTRDAEEAMNPGTSSPLNRLPVRTDGDMIAVL